MAVASQRLLRPLYRGNITPKYPIPIIRRIIIPNLRLLLVKYQGPPVKCKRPIPGANWRVLFLQVSGVRHI